MAPCDRATDGEKLGKWAEKLDKSVRTVVIESVFDQLKHISQIEHSHLSASHTLRDRSPVNCLVNILCGLIAYCQQPKKPSIALDYNLLPSA